MKKLSTLFGIGALSVVLFTGVPNHSFATSSTPDSVTDATYSKFVSVNKYYDGKVTPRQTITYNSHGYSGTLTLDDYAYDGTMTLASYSGYVNCSGLCPIE
ncbi:hypothetical protein JFL43_03310 [Viridibacillus sp. YIM B01967]|uniref:Uncharacterized protein n=1 Tax=Viridibacillus soli TaxID=2798301 RepID=A0ABS1H3A4_9BACL|nr:hypothetical protein [Viridibacillus soli]MBK3493900.1 hypothetical protein [Viridibacillus soli]